ncbi:hypothetical protein LX36DRAFT_424209 [Colletotrichum falcatum]|nr:hypothetical protein LX36DRAFT_424209 [Colletotrichum falcatum]
MSVCKRESLDMFFLWMLDNYVGLPSLAMHPSIRTWFPRAGATTTSMLTDSFPIEIPRLPTPRLCQPICLLALAFVYESAWAHAESVYIYFRDDIVRKGLSDILTRPQAGPLPLNTAVAMLRRRRFWQLQYMAVYATTPLFSGGVTVRGSLSE